MKMIRYRKPSLKTALGVTRAKRRLAKATGIPTTKAGRKRKTLNALTGGAYGKYQRMRADMTRPYRVVRRPASCMGFLLSMLLIAVLAGWLMALLI